MYAKCGDMRGAELTFKNQSSQGNVVAWNSIMQGYLDNGNYNRVLELFSAIKNSRSCRPDSRTFVAAVKSCSKLAAAETGVKLDGVSLKVGTLQRGMAIHSQAVQEKFISDSYLEASLIDMYASCGLMTDARRCFDGISQRNSVSWTALINGYAENGQADLALEAFSSMQSEGFQANSYTYLAAIKACNKLAAKEDELVKTRSLEKAMAIHSEALRKNHWDMHLASSLVDTYAKFGCVEMARWIFDGLEVHGLVLWNSLISGYAESKLALQLFELMMSSGCCLPDSWTFVAALKACIVLARDEQASKLEDQNGNENIKVKIKSLEIAMAVHAQAAKRRLDCKDAYVASSLVEVYANCGSMVDSKRTFDSCVLHHPVLWSGLTSGYCENHQEDVALMLIKDIWIQESTLPDPWTFVAALKASKNIGELRTGKTIHGQICRYGFDDEFSIVSQLVDFYVKCGNISQAETIFYSCKQMKASTWTSMITGYSLEGNPRVVFELFQKMLDEQVKPDSITFLGVLTACSHAGLVDKGREVLATMSSSKFGIVPSVEHYHCVADMLCRAGKVDHAVQLLQKMPCEANAVTWILIMEACKKWKNVALAEKAFQELREFEDNAANYLMLSNTRSVQ